MSGRHRLRPTSAAIPALVVLSLLTAGPAAAAPVTLGGGSGIVVDGDTYCTLTTIGTDNRGELIGFTSAHCGGPGAKVAAESAKDAGPVGEMVAGNDGLDYAVIKFDPAKVTPTDNVNGFVISGLGPDRSSAISPANWAAPPGRRAASPGGPARTRAPSSTRCAVSRAIPARR